MAGFIGSPQMNFFDVHFSKQGDKTYAVFGENAIAVPQEILRRFKDESYLQKEVTMGIRPEDIDDDPEFVAAHPDSTIKVHVEVTELMGAETYLYFTTSGKENKEENVIARVDPRTKTRTGDDTVVALDTSRLHFFEKDTKNEETILNRA